MKILRIDWRDFLGFMEAWQGLTASARRFLIGLAPKAVLSPVTAGAELPHLLAGGFLTRAEDGEHLQVSSAFHESHKVLRALVRHPLLAHPGPHQLLEYLKEHYTNDERHGLSEAIHWPHRDELLITKITSARYVRGFLAAKDVRAWEKKRLPRSPWSQGGTQTQSRALLSDAKAAADLVRLVESLCAATEPILFRELAQRTGSLSRTRLGPAIEAGLRYLLCFAALDAELEPVLTPWPGVLARLHRVQASAPAVAEPTESFCLATMVEDLTQLLVRAAEPLRMKSDGDEPFVAVQRELERGLLPLPPWLIHPELFPENTPDSRVHDMLELARWLEFVAPNGKRGPDSGLQTTPDGWKWLDLGPRERLAVVLDLMRVVPKPRSKPARVPEEGGVDWMEFDDLVDSFDDELIGADGGLDVLTERSLFGFPGDGSLASAAIQAFATLRPGRPVLFHAFLEHHAQASNPFLGLETLPRSAGFVGYGGELTEEMLEERWIHALQRVLHLALLPTGGVRAGVSKEGSLTVEITSVGRYLLGLEPSFTIEASVEPSRTPVRVQPDFEVVFVARSPSQEAAISRFAERRGSGVGVLFQITRASILAASLAGLTAEEVLGTLTQASASPVPANVEHEIRAWFEGCRRLALEAVHLIRCPDAATAARVLAAAGAGKLEPLSETVLALSDPQHKAAVVRACRKAGLFLVGVVEEPDAPRRRARARRRRY